MTQYFGLSTFVPVQGTTVHAHGNTIGQIGGQYIVSNTPAQSYLNPLNSVGTQWFSQQGSHHNLGGSILGTIGGQLGYLTPGSNLENSYGGWNQGTTLALIPTNSTNQIGGTQSPWGTSTGWGSTSSVGHWGQAQTGQSIQQGWNPSNLGSNSGSAQTSFATELAETTSEYVLSFDVPGMELNNIDVSLGGNTLYINGIRTGLQGSSALTYSEVARGNISRALTLPFDVSGQKAINTSLENGVLKIRISKEDQGSRKNTTRKIQIG